MLKYIPIYTVVSCTILYMFIGSPCNPKIYTYISVSSLIELYIHIYIYYSLPFIGIIYTLFKGTKQICPTVVAPGPPYHHLSLGRYIWLTVPMNICRPTQAYA